MLNKYTFDKADSLQGYFEISPKSDFRKKVIKVITKEDSYQPFLFLFCEYLTSILKIKDYKIIRKYMFRYSLLILYITYKDGKNPYLNSKSLNAIISKKLAKNVFDEDVKEEENDLWSKIYNQCTYNNEFSKIDAIDDKVKMKIHNVLFNKERFFNISGLFIESLTNKDNNKLFFDEIICETLHNEVELSSISITYDNEDILDTYIHDKSKHELDDKKLLFFVLNEAIKQDKLSPESRIIIKNQKYYQIIANLHGGSLSYVEFVKNDTQNSAIIFDFEVVVQPLYFTLNDQKYKLSVTGIEKI